MPQIIRVAFSLGGGVVAVGTVDAPIGVTGVTMLSNDIFAVSPETNPGKDSTFSVRLGAVIRAGTNGMTTVALSVVQLDGSDMVLPGTRLTTAKPAYTRATSLEFVETTARGGIVCLRLVGHSTVAAGDANLASVTVRLLVSG